VGRVERERAKAKDALTPEVAENGANQHAGGSDNVTPSDRGNSRAYVVGKLKREAAKAELPRPFDVRAQRLRY
jgi:hypothetical protein